MTTYRNFRIIKTENEEYIISFAVGVRKRNMRISSVFNNIEDAKKEIDFRILSLRNEGKFYNGNTTINYDMCANIGIAEYNEINNITFKK